MVDGLVFENFSNSYPLPAVKVLTAEEYYHGELDWYNLNVNKSTETLGDVDIETSELEKTHTFFPTPIQFEGMPNTRWWTFEEGKTNFGDIKPDTTELNKQLLIEFGLVYGNDWFLAPLTSPAGTMIFDKVLTKIKPCNFCACRLQASQNSSILFYLL